MVQFWAGKRNKRNIGRWKKENSMLKAMGTGWRVTNEAHKIISLCRPQSFWSMIWEITYNNECFRGKSLKKEIKKNCCKGIGFSMSTEILRTGAAEPEAI